MLSHQHHCSAWSFALRQTAPISLRPLRLAWSRSSTRRTPSRRSTRTNTSWRAAPHPDARLPSQRNPSGIDPIALSRHAHRMRCVPAARSTRLRQRVHRGLQITAQAPGLSSRAAQTCRSAEETPDPVEIERPPSMPLASTVYLQRAGSSTSGNAQTIDLLRA